MCGAFTPDCGYKNSTNNLIGTCIVQIQSVPGKIDCTERLFNLSAEAIINVHNVPLCARCAIVFLKIKQIPFFVVWSRGLRFWIESKTNSRWYRRYVLFGNYCFDREKCEFLDSYVTTPRSISDCGKCGAWLFVHKIPFMLHEHVKTAKTDKNTIFLCGKKINLVPRKQMLLSVPFQSTRKRKKELCVDNKLQKTIGDVYCPTCGIEKWVFVSNNEKTKFYDWKKCKAGCQVLKNTFKDQKWQLCCLKLMVHIDLQEKRVKTKKKKSHLHFWKKSSANHNQAHPNLNQKKQKLFHLWHNRVDTPLVDTVNRIILYILIFCTFSQL